MLSPILICTDGSPAAVRALDVALDLTGDHPVVALAVWVPLSTQLAESGSVGVIAAGEHESFDATEQSAAQAGVAAAAERATAAGRPVTTRVERADRSVSHAILAVADEIDAALIVCGTRGRGPIAGMVLGSVSHAVLNHSHRPVLITPQPA